MKVSFPDPLNTYSYASRRYSFEPHFFRTFCFSFLPFLDFKKDTFRLSSELFPFILTFIGKSQCCCLAKHLISDFVSPRNRFLPHGNVFRPKRKSCVTFEPSYLSAGKVGTNASVCQSWRRHKKAIWRTRRRRKQVNSQLFFDFMSTQILMHKWQW